jgi:hypothetical protein
MELVKRIFQSVSREDNKGIFGITTLGGVFCSWHLISVDVVGFCRDHELMVKGILGLFSIFIAPPLGVFMKDVYQIKVKPKIFKDKHKY